MEHTVSSALHKRGVERVVAGISGGADSVALLRALVASGVDMKALHCNFHLRGEESDRDFRFVETLCERLDVALEVVDFDVEEYRKKNGGSLEMACRELRYNYFEQKRVEFNADRVVVAHNSDDNAETVLLNLLRGSGIAGLRGMKTDTGKIIRPLLNVSRADIEAYLAALSQPFIIDSTNLSSDFRRNFLRNKVIPLIEKEWPEAKRSINKTASIMGKEEAGINALTEGIISARILPYNIIKEKDSGKFLLRRFVVSKGGSDTMVEEIYDCINKAEVRKGARWDCKSGTFVIGKTGLEWLEGKELPEATDLSEEFEWIKVKNSDLLIAKIKKERSNDCLWVPIPPTHLSLRTRKKGDRMKPMGMNGSRLVSDIISDSGMTAFEKRDLTVAQHIETGEILWVEKLRRSRLFLISPQDEYVFCIKRKENWKKLGK